MLKVYQPQQLLDTELITDLHRAADRYGKSQDSFDGAKWHLAQLVSDMWDEHKSLGRMEYFAECSRILNQIGVKKRFSDSGETLRRMVELYDTFKPFFAKVKDAEKLLDIATQDHMRIARSVYLKGKVSSPFEAIKWAFPENGEKKSADEMLYHFDPPAPQPEHKPGGFINKFMDWTAPLRRGWSEEKKTSFDADVKSLYERYFK